MQFPLPPPNKDNPLSFKGFFFLQLSIGFTLSLNAETISTLHNDKDSIALIEGFIAAGKPVATVCHAPAVLLKAKAPNGDSLVLGKNVTGFSNSEEAAVELTNIVPYLLEDELVAMGGLYQKIEDWNSLAVVDGLIITGQNPGSSAAVAEALVKTIKQL